MRLSGWGRYPIIDCAVARPGSAAAVSPMLDDLPSVIARGNGRSYGDASVNADAVVDMRRIDHLIDFDPESGRIVCEGGTLLSELIDAMLPRGWFPPVTPGTRQVTIGGMIASDVHGKNHHGAGSFCDHLAWIDLAIGEGRVLRCSPCDHADLFAATCGGMGLTGVILRACFRLIPVQSAAVRQRTIRAPKLDDALAAFEASLDWTYSVAWIDCLAGGGDIGRSVVLLGEHAVPDDLPAARRATGLIPPRRKNKRIPVDFPAFALGPTPVRLFNRLYYAAQRPGDRIVDIDPYFYPLDTVHDWNRIYGRRGFVQYQCVMPLRSSRDGLTQILTEVAARGGASFLAVLKRMGPASFGLLSFPMEGYTLTLDFPVNDCNLALIDRIDAISRDHGGRIYLAKDALASPKGFAAGYPRLEAFRQVRRHYELDRHFQSHLSRRLEI